MCSPEVFLNCIFNLVSPINMCGPHMFYHLMFVLPFGFPQTWFLTPGQSEVSEKYVACKPLWQPAVAKFVAS